jgi:hypothetical protein
MLIGRSDGNTRLYKRKWEDDVRNGSSRGCGAWAELNWLRIWSSSKTGSCVYGSIKKARALGLSHTCATPPNYKTVVILVVQYELRGVQF